MDRLGAMLEGMNPEQTAALDKLIAEETAKPWLPTPGPQLEAFLSPADLLLYGGAAGGGKGQALDAKVLTPFGYREMGSLRLGSAVSCPDGSVANVIGIFPLGERQLYRVAFRDGTSTEVTDDHIWRVWRSRRSAKHCGVCRGGEASAKLSTTSAMMLDVDAAKYRIPITEPVAFNDVARYERRPVPPYFLGVLLGDGSITKKCLRITCADPEIIGRIHAEGLDTIGPYNYGTSASEYRLREPNTVRPHLEKWGLIGKGSDEKFIPSSYLVGSVEQRWELLRGLMDTDGWCDLDGDAYYRTISPRLRDDVAALARSLGALVTIREKDAKDQNGRGSRAFTLRLKFRDGRLAFGLERKQARCLPRPPQSMGRRIVSIEATRVALAQCIKISHVDGLYLTNDYIVTHNTDLICGLGLTEHQRTVVFRKQSTDLDGFWERLMEVCPNPRAKDSNKKKLTTIDGRMLECGHLDAPGSERAWQGRPHDLIAFDEGAQLSAYKVNFVLGWLRSADGRRCRAVIGSNPPIGGEGSWLIEWFAPWLDPLFANPAKPGELRYAYSVGDGDEIRTVWVDGPEPVEVEGEMRTPLSRTFIPSKLNDNPYLRDTNYRAQIDSMPEPLRSQLLHGDFLAGREDDEWQIIPSEWVRLAQARWKEPSKVVMRSMGVDVAQGGPDSSTIAPLYDGNLFGRVGTWPGRETPDGPSVANLILKVRRDSAAIGLDTTGGWGGSARDHLRTHHEVETVAVVFSAAGTGMDPQTKLEYHNLRAQMYWSLRLALDPSSGEDVALPPGDRTLAQLTASRWKPKSGKILVESKDDIRKRLGVSPDEADAIVIAWHIRNRSFKRERPGPKIHKGPRLSGGSGWLGG